MSPFDLPALLADPAPSGAYFVDTHDRAALVEAAHGLEFRVASIDCRGVRDRDGGLARIAQSLDFPAWFGGNWDALQDSLRDLSWLPGDGYLLLFDHSSGWRDADPEGVATLIEILNQAGQAWAADRVPFWALLPLPGEELATMNA